MIEIRRYRCKNVISKDVKKNYNKSAKDTVELQNCHHSIYDWSLGSGGENINPQIILNYRRKVWMLQENTLH